MALRQARERPTGEEFRPDHSGVVPPGFADSPPKGGDGYPPQDRDGDRPAIVRRRPRLLPGKARKGFGLAERILIITGGGAHGRIQRRLERRTMLRGTILLPMAIARTCRGTDAPAESPRG